MGFMEKMQMESSISTASGQDYHYVVLQVTLKEKFFGTGSGNLVELEQVINAQAKKGYVYTPSPPPTVAARALAAATASKPPWSLKK